MGKLTGGWHRRAVECAVDDVRHWRFELYFFSSIAIVFSLLGLMGILSGKLSGLVGLGLGGFFLWYAWGFSPCGKMRKATHEQRIRIIANEYKVSVEEVEAKLEAKK